MPEKTRNTRSRPTPTENHITKAVARLTARGAAPRRAA